MELVYSVCVCLIFVPFTTAKVLPPTNVTLRCGNLHNVVEWTYGQLSPGLRFRIDFNSLKGLPDRTVLWVDPPTLQADVSFLSDPSDDYILAVTAVNGEDVSESAPSEGIEFSYFQDSLAQQKCSLDFPPVNVTAQLDGKVLFRFTHPWLFYPPNLPNPKPQKNKRHDAPIPEDLPLFTYDVEMIDQEPHEFLCEESVCENTFSVDAAQEKHCLRFTGQLDKMLVQSTQEYCAAPYKAPNNIIPYIVVVSLLVVVVFVVIVLMVYRKETNSSTTFPHSMSIKGQVKQWTTGIVRETVVVPELGPTSPSPLLSDEVNESTPASTPFTEYDLRLPIGMSTENDGVCDVTEVGQQKDEYMQGTNLDEDEFTTLNSSEAPSSYEKRHVFVELAPGEQAEGYRG